MNGKSNSTVCDDGAAKIADDVFTALSRNANYGLDYLDDGVSILLTNGSDEYIVKVEAAR